MNESLAPVAAPNPEPGPEPRPAPVSGASGESGAPVGASSRAPYTAVRTRPWLDDEYIRINNWHNWPLVYSLRDGVMLVRLPGGHALSPAALQAAGAVVTFPARIHVEAADA